MKAASFTPLSIYFPPCCWNWLSGPPVKFFGPFMVLSSSGPQTMRVDISALLGRTPSGGFFLGVRPPNSNFPLRMICLFPFWVFVYSSPTPNVAYMPRRVAYLPQRFGFPLVFLMRGICDVFLPRPIVPLDALNPPKKRGLRHPQRPSFTSPCLCSGSAILN